MRILPRPPNLRSLGRHSCKLSAIAMRRLWQWLRAQHWRTIRSESSLGQGWDEMMTSAPNISLGETPTGDEVTYQGGNKVVACQGAAVSA